MPAQSVSTARTSLDSQGHPFCKDSLLLPCQIPSPHSSQGHLEQSLGGWALAAVGSLSVLEEPRGCG